MPVNSSPCFYICYPNSAPALGEIYLFHLCSPSWFAQLRQVGSGVEVNIIKFMGQPPEKEVLDASLKEANEFVRDFFLKAEQKGKIIRK